MPWSAVSLSGSGGGGGPLWGCVLPSRGGERKGSHLPHLRHRGSVLPAETPVARDGSRVVSREKNIQTAGFEPAPSKRLVPETSALDRSATSAYIFIIISSKMN